MRADQREFDAWAAGFIDGEGCILIERRVQTRLGFPTYALSVQVGQSGNDGPPRELELLQERFGGTVNRKSKTGLAKKPQYLWKVSASRAEYMLQCLLPYLVGKKEQAEIALSYRRNAVGRGRNSDAPVYRARLQELKRS